MNTTTTTVSTTTVVPYYWLIECHKNLKVGIQKMKIQVVSRPSRCYKTRCYLEPEGIVAYIVPQPAVINEDILLCCGFIGKGLTESRGSAWFEPCHVVGDGPVGCSVVSNELYLEGDLGWPLQLVVVLSWERLHPHSHGLATTRTKPISVNPMLNL